MFQPCSVTILQPILPKFCGNISNFVSSNGIAMALNYSGIILLGSMLSLQYLFYDTNYPTYHFQI
jgi:hypothetical protein